MIQLHYYPSTAAMVPHILLEEIGVPYERVLVDRAVGRAQAAGLSAAQPQRPDPGADRWRPGAVRNCRDRAAPVRYPSAGEAGARSSARAERAHFYKWLMWLTNTLQATLIVYFYPERWVDEGNAAGVAEVKAHAERKVAGAARSTRCRAGAPRPALVRAARSTARSIRTSSRCAAGRAISANEQPAREPPHLGPYLQRMLARPAVAARDRHRKAVPPFV